MIVCVCVRSFLQLRASRSRNIGRYFVQKLRRHLLAPNATNYILPSHKIRIPTESTQRGYDKTIRDFI